jgi:hypothetical protein
VDPFGPALKARKVLLEDLISRTHTWNDVCVNRVIGRVVENAPLILPEFKLNAGRLLTEFGAHVTDVPSNVFTTAPDPLLSDNAVSVLPDNVNEVVSDASNHNAQFGTLRGSKAVVRDCPNRLARSLILIRTGEQYLLL